MRHSVCDIARLRFAPAAFVAAALLSGCATANIEDAAPVAAAQPAVQPAATAAVNAAPPSFPPAPSGPPVAALQPASGPIDTGAYPNLNIAPGVAAPQITPTERAQKFGELRAAQEGQSASVSGQPKAADPAYLKKLGATHAADTLKQIQGR